MSRRGATSRRVRGYQGIALILVIVLVAVVLRRHIVTTTTLIFFGVLFVSIILHEVSHGAAALLFGDDTAKQAGRLTLNPIPHVDIVGTIILPAVMLLVGFGAFGYAKPVPVNVGRLRSPRNQSLVVSLVGPAVNIVLAVIAAVVLRAVTQPGLPIVTGQASVGVLVLVFLGYANVLLAAFNLIPIPPLDGSAVIERLLPTAWWPFYLRLRMYSLPVIFGVVLLFPGALNHVFYPALNWWAHVLHRGIVISGPI
ncbi:MAG: site-2 protease family protein [Acidimicrobiales bacterium]